MDRCQVPLKSYVGNEPVQLQCVLSMEHLGPHVWEDGSRSVSNDDYPNAELHRRLDAIERVIHENLGYTKSVQRQMLTKADATEDTRLRTVAADMAVRAAKDGEPEQDTKLRMEMIYRFITGPVGTSDAVAYAHTVFRDQQLNAAQHQSDCSLHNEPAYPALPCDCGAIQVSKKEADDFNDWGSSS